MGASQSALSEPTSAESAETKPILPYGLSKDSKHIYLDSSCRSLYGGIISLVENNKYADLVIICGDDRYPVHRAIVCPRSHFFADRCAAAEGESDDASPAKPTKIWIDPSECESHILAAVLTFLYTLDYNASGPQTLTFGLPEAKEDAEQDIASPPRSLAKLGIEEERSVLSDDGVVSMTTSVADTPDRSSTESVCSARQSDPSDLPNELFFHFQTYMAAQRFGIDGLCHIASEKLKKRLRSGPWKLEMIPCIREVYRHGNNSKVVDMKEEIVKSARSRFRDLKSSEGWDNLIMESPEFGAELLRRL